MRQLFLDLSIHPSYNGHRKRGAVILLLESTVAEPL